jgi:hypothetical protein
MSLRLSAPVEQQTIVAATGNGKDAGVARSLLAIKSSARRHGYAWNRVEPIPAPLPDAARVEQAELVRIVSAEG